MKRRRFNFPWRTKSAIQSDAVEELRFHIDARTDDLVSQGTEPTVARAQATREFGDVEGTRDFINQFDRGTEQETRRKDYLDDLKQDLIYAVRKLRSSPAFTITAIVTLALGIGANTAIFSVVDGVLLKPLPFPHPEQLLKVWSANKNSKSFQASVSALDLEDWRKQQTKLTDIGGYYFADGGSGIDLTGLGDPQRLSVAFVEPGFFPTLGTTPIDGRLPREDEMVRGGNDKVVVLSHGFWQRQFGSSHAVFGTTVTLNGSPYQVLGVMPADFTFPSEHVDVYIPNSSVPDNATPRIRPVRILEVVARMKPGVTITEVSAELSTIADRLSKEYPVDGSWGAVTVKPLQDALTSSVRTALFVLLGAVAFVLAMGCVNVASLLLARASVREREIAVRAALGASRGRIVRQLLTESIVLALAGGAAGIAMGAAGIRLLLALSAGQLPRGTNVHLDGTVLLFALALSILTGLLFGLLPAVRASKTVLAGTLREAGRSVAGGAQRLRSALVIAEVALAVVLVVGAGLMTRSFVQLLKVDPGFRPDHLLAVNFTLDYVHHPKDWQLTYHSVIERTRALPGVVAAGAVRDAPFRGNGERNAIVPIGYVVPAGGDAPSCQVMFISDGYFKTIGTQIIAGREFLQTDRADGPITVVVNEAYAKQWFPDGALGKSLNLGKAAEIVGVVQDIRQSSIDEPARPTVYINNMVNGRVKVTLVARTQGEPLQMARQVRDAIWSVERQQAITSIFTYDDVVGESMARPRLLTVLLGGFGALGLILGALGIYGVLAYLVNERSREIGVRIALGAPASSVLWMFVGRGLALTTAGLTIGLVGAFGLTRYIGGVLYDVKPTDPLTFAAVAIVLLSVAVLASWLPARRAAHLDPVVALRSD